MTIYSFNHEPSVWGVMEMCGDYGIDLRSCRYAFYDSSTDELIDTDEEWYQGYLEGTWTYRELCLYIKTKLEDGISVRVKDPVSPNDRCIMFLP